jgi:hypothetical protein
VITSYMTTLRLVIPSLKQSGIGVGRWTRHPNRRPLTGPPLSKRPVTPNPAVILAKAKAAWAAAKKPKFLSKLNEWLDGRCWEEQPLQKEPSQKHSNKTINRADDPMIDADHPYDAFDNWILTIADLSEWRDQVKKMLANLAEIEAEKPEVVRSTLDMADRWVRRYAALIEKMLLEWQKDRDWFDRDELYNDEGGVKREHLAYKIISMDRSYNFALGEKYTLPMIDALYGKRINPCVLEIAIRHIRDNEIRQPNSSAVMFKIIKEATKDYVDFGEDAINEFRKLRDELQAAIAKAKTPSQTSIVHSDQKDNNLPVMDKGTGLLLAPQQHTIVRRAQHCVDDVDKFIAHIKAATALLTIDRFGFCTADRNITDQQLRTIVDEAICAVAVFKSTEMDDARRFDP